jgi:hypothetical protein
VTESSTPLATMTTGTPANKGVKQGLPAIGLPTAEEAATKLWAVARLGTTTPEAFARQFGERTKASGSKWDSRMAMLRGFKLLRFEDKQLGLSELGQQLLNASNPTEQIKARQTAVMNLKAYRELVEAYNGTALPDITAVATKLQFEYGKKEEFAKRAAQAFADSLTHAQMLDEENIVRKDGVTATDTQATFPVPPQGVETADSDDDEMQAAEIDRAFDEDEPESDGDEPPAAPLEQIGQVLSAPKVSLTLTLDLSNFRADDVVRILAALGFGVRG